MLAWFEKLPTRRCQENRTEKRRSPRSAATRRTGSGSITSTGSTTVVSTDHTIARAIKSYNTPLGTR